MVTISESSVALLVDVMWEVLPSSSGASEVLLDQIIKDQELYSLRQVSGTHSNHEQFPNLKFSDYHQFNGLSLVNPTILSIYAKEMFLQIPIISKYLSVHVHHSAHKIGNIFISR